MKTDKNILIAFLLNLGFSAFEIIGGIFTGSVAIVSDAVHDLGDAVSIGISYFLERRSKRAPDEKYTFGYLRFSVLGGLITTLILALGSFAVIIGAVGRIFNPVPIHYDGMIIFAIIGVAVNFIAAIFTRGEGSVGQRAVNLHMLEDVLGWVVVLIGATVMRFTDISVIDPIMSLAVAIFILVNAIRSLWEITGLFLERTPDGIDISEICEHICELDGVLDVHHIHVRSLDGMKNYCTMHIVYEGDAWEVKRRVREELAHHGICHCTLELEREGEDCESHECEITHDAQKGHHHHHHHH